MSQTLYERGQFIRSRIHLSILMALGKGKINAEESGRIFDLISFVETSGSTHNEELAKESFYIQAVKDWGKVKERRRMKYENR